MRQPALWCCFFLLPSLPAEVICNEAEPGPLRKAARDLASDLNKVVGKGKTPRIVVALNHNLPAGVERPSGWEVLRMQTAGSTVVLTGSDLRGAIYAVYQFAQDYLGVDPLWWWTDHAPARRSELRLPASLSRTEGPPAFRYRGWFINDEDLLTGWKPGAADRTGISLEVWDRVFEAVLRLKGNMIVPGTFLFPDEPQVRAAGERGLVITQHHIEVVGLNTYRWPDHQPYSFASAPELMTAAWRRAIRQYAPAQEVIWTLGYRGRHDRPFWIDDAAAGLTDAERGRLIRSAIDRQVEIVRRERGGSPYFLMNAWVEGVPLIRQGHLKIPDGVTLVWPDNGHGLIRGDGTMGKGQGVYYHTAMYNSRANQLTEMIPLERLARELGRAARAGGTEYLLDNISDIRPVVMTTRALMELAWDGKLDPEAYLDKWCREQFGERAARAVAEYYRAYFAAPARYGPAEDEVMGDNFYHTLARDLLVRRITGDKSPHRYAQYFPDPSNLEAYAARLAAVTAEAEPRWEQARRVAEKARPLVAPHRGDFFQGHVLTQLAIHQHSNRMLRLVAEGKLPEAMAEIQKILDALRAAEYGQWAGFYSNDLFVNVRHSLALLRGEGPVAVRPADPYVALKAYQAGRRVEF